MDFGVLFFISFQHSLFQLPGQKAGRDRCQRRKRSESNGVAVGDMSYSKLMWQAMKTSEIRFSQDSIKGYFQNKGRCNDVADRLVQGNLSPKKIPRIKVCEKDGKYYSLDNRRLYVFRVAEMQHKLDKIPVLLVPYMPSHNFKFTTENDGRTVEVRKGSTLDHCAPEWLLVNKPDNATWCGCIIM